MKWNLAKLYEKCSKRIGMTVFEKEGMRCGTIRDFVILDNPEGGYYVEFYVVFKKDGVAVIELIHESELVLVLDDRH